MKYKELTHKIIGCAMKVHNTLGNGFQEVIYQRALAIEMESQGLKYQRELGMPIYYEGNNIGTRRVDFPVIPVRQYRLLPVGFLHCLPHGQPACHLLMRRDVTLVNKGLTPSG